MIEGKVYVLGLSWSILVNLTQSRVTWEEGVSTEESSPSDWAMVAFSGLWALAMGTFS